MTVLAGLFRVTIAVLLLVNLNGCLPSAQSQSEEEKEAHFLTGKSCINSMDYKGAIEEFEKALEVNPRSASAHFQLGWLYEEKESDPAAAIYHYQQFLKLRPGAENAEVIKQHINNCKQDLAKTVLPLPVTPGMQHEFEQLAEDNKRLRDELEKWRAYYASRPQNGTNSSPLPAAPENAASPQPAPQTAQSSPSQRNPASPNRPSAGATRTHTVQSGESPYSIARKYNVKLDALLAANPKLDPKRLRVGQTLMIPSP